MNNLLGFKIIPNKLYTTEEMMAFFQIRSSRTVSQLRKKGLQYSKVGSRVFFEGADLIAFIKSKKQQAIIHE